MDRWIDRLIYVLHIPRYMYIYTCPASKVTVGTVRSKGFATYSARKLTARAVRSQGFRIYVPTKLKHVLPRLPGVYVGGRLFEAFLAPPLQVSALQPDLSLLSCRK